MAELEVVGTSRQQVCADLYVGQHLERAHSCVAVKAAAHIHLRNLIRQLFQGHLMGADAHAHRKVLLCFLLQTWQ